MPLGRSKKTEVFKSNMAPNPLVCADDVNVLGESYVLRKKRQEWDRTNKVRFSHFAYLRSYMFRLKKHPREDDKTVTY